MLNNNQLGTLNSEKNKVYRQLVTFSFICLLLAFVFLLFSVIFYYFSENHRWFNIPSGICISISAGLVLMFFFSLFLEFLKLERILDIQISKVFTDALNLQILNRNELAYLRSNIDKLLFSKEDVEREESYYNYIMNNLLMPSSKIPYKDEYSREVIIEEEEDNEGVTIWKWTDSATYTIKYPYFDPDIPSPFLLRLNFTILLDQKKDVNGKYLDDTHEYISENFPKNPIELIVDGKSKKHTFNNFEKYHPYKYQNFSVANIGQNQGISLYNRIDNKTLQILWYYHLPICSKETSVVKKVISLEKPGDTYFFVPVREMVKGCKFKMKIPDHLVFDGALPGGFPNYPVDVFPFPKQAINSIKTSEIHFEKRKSLVNIRIHGWMMPGLLVALNWRER